MQHIRLLQVKKQKKTELFSHVATTFQTTPRRSLHVKFDSKVVAYCRRTPRTGYKGGKRRSFAFQLVIEQCLAKQVQCFVSQFMVTLQPRPRCAFPSSQVKSPWGRDW